MRFIAVDKRQESKNIDKERIVLAPLDKGKLAADFGAAEYLIVTIKDGEAPRKEIVENEFYKKNGGHGVMFVKMQKADKVYAHYLGEGAKQNLQANNIEIEILADLLAVNDLYERIIKNET
jgi:predicted Fe-Mo cluster-binding NifX family protein